ncbi:MAG: CheR family methyltransferase [Planctomycetota bacterium]
MGESADEPPLRMVVGVGTHEVGADVLAFISSLPEDLAARGIALVVAGPARLIGQVSRRTALRPYVVATGARLSAGAVFLALPGTRLSLDGAGCLRVEGGSTRPLDTLFRSLVGLGRRAAGVFFPGQDAAPADGDGIAGLTALRAAGVPTFACADSEPQSLALVECVLPAAALAPALLRQAEAEAQRPRRERALGARVQLLLEQRHGVDLSLYQPQVLDRLLDRALERSGCQDPGEYLERIEQDPAELDLLVDQRLVGVTSFFRAPASFARLAELGFDALLRRDSLRVWVPGCSTGQEAYSLAMALHERLAALGRPLVAQLFATDADPRAVATARAGRYPRRLVAAEVDEGRLARYFEPCEGQPGEPELRVVEAIRRVLVFAPQDVLRDPPFLHLDLISCRNLLIYFRPAVQRSLLLLFHRALRVGGLLFLGEAEGALPPPELFEPLDQGCLFRRREVPGPKGLALVRGSAGGRTLSRAAAADRMLFEDFVPPSVLVTTRGQVVHVRGEVGPYLSPVQGDSMPDVFRLARAGLAPYIARALAAAAADEGLGAHRVVAPLGDELEVELLARPARGDELSGLFTISFLPLARAGSPGAETLEELAALRGEVASATHRLTAAREGARAAYELLAGLRHELQLADEALAASEEEVRALSAELEATKAELLAVGAELEAELARPAPLTDELLEQLPLVLLALQDGLRLVWASAEAGRLFGLRAGDAGRPLDDLVPLSPLSGAALAALETRAGRTLTLTPRPAARALAARLSPLGGADPRRLAVTFVELQPGRASLGARTPEEVA